MIVFTCSQCDKKLRVADTKAGARVKCPGCGGPITVPEDLSGEPPDEAASQPSAGAKGKVVTDAVTAKERAPKPVAARTGASAKRPLQRKKRAADDEDDEDDQPSSKVGLWVGLGVGGALVSVGVVVALVVFGGDKDKRTSVAAVNPGASVVTPQKRVSPSAVAPAPQPKVTPAPVVPAKEDEALKLLTVVATPRPEDIFQHVLKSTAWVFAGTNEQPTTSGTGSLVDRQNRLILTNYHVVANSVKFAVFFPTYKDGHLVQAKDEYLKDLIKGKTQAILYGKLLAADKRRDLALIQVDNLPPEVQALPMAENSVGTGQNVMSVGNPGTSGAVWVYTPGTVRAIYHKKFIAAGVGLQFEVDAMVVETNSAVNPGDSGGPLVNEQGELVGVTQGLDQNARLVSFFIDLSEAVSFIDATCKSKSLSWVRDGKPLMARSKVAIPDLIKLLEHENPKVRRLAVEELGKRGPRAQLAIPALVKTLTDKDDIISRTAVQALNNLGKADKADVALLRTSLQDTSERVRTYAAAALGKLGTEARAAVPELIKALGDTVPLVRRYAAESLGKMGVDARDTAVPALTTALKDDDKEVRVAAAEAMTLVMTPLAAADLPVVFEQLLKHKDVEVRVQGARALGQLRSEATKVLPVLGDLCKTGTEKRLRLAALASLAQFGASAKPAILILIEALKDTDSELRQAAGLALGKIGPEAKQAVPALGEALKDSDKAIRVSAVIALGKIGPEAKPAIPALRQLLQEKDREQRLQTVIALGEFGKGAKDAIPDMIQAFADEELDKELSVITQVKNLGAQTNPQNNVQIDALKLALTLAVNNALKKLDKEFQEKNVEALNKIGKVAVPALIKGLGDTNTFVRWGSIKALAKLGPLPPQQASVAAQVFWYIAQREPIPDIQREAATAAQKVQAKR